MFFNISVKDPSLLEQQIFHILTLLLASSPEDRMIHERALRTLFNKERHAFDTAMANALQTIQLQFGESTRTLLEDLALHILDEAQVEYFHEDGSVSTLYAIGVAAGAIQPERMQMTSLTTAQCEQISKLLLTHYFNKEAMVELKVYQGVPKVHHSTLMYHEDLYALLEAMVHSDGHFVAPIERFEVDPEPTNTSEDLMGDFMDNLRLVFFCIRREAAGPNRLPVQVTPYHCLSGLKNSLFEQTSSLMWVRSTPFGQGLLALWNAACGTHFTYFFTEPYLALHTFRHVKQYLAMAGVAYAHERLASLLSPRAGDPLQLTFMTAQLTDREEFRVGFLRYSNPSKILYGYRLEGEVEESEEDLCARLLTLLKVLTELGITPYYMDGNVMRVKDLKDSDELQVYRTAKSELSYFYKDEHWPVQLAELQKRRLFN